MALLDRRLDSPAAFAIWLVSHAGCSNFFMSLVAAERD